MTFSQFNYCFYILYKQYTILLSVPRAYFPIALPMVYHWMYVCVYEYIHIYLSFVHWELIEIHITLVLMSTPSAQILISKHDSTIKEQGLLKEDTDFSSREGKNIKWFWNILWYLKVKKFFKKSWGRKVADRMLLCNHSTIINQWYIIISMHTLFDIHHLFQ